MPYFSFSLKDNFDCNILKNVTEYSYKLKKETKYFSKNTLLWRLLNKKKINKHINFIKFEKRKKISKLENNILFCLPPSIGLGDSVEYALGIHAILKKNIFKKIGIAYVGRYSEIFKKYFLINDLYEDFISEKEIAKYENIFHMSHEIKDLEYQKYNRKDIEQKIVNYFNISKNHKINLTCKYKNLKKIKKLSFFPISKSPIRTLNARLLNLLIDHYFDKYEIEIVFDFNSDISDKVEAEILQKKINYKKPKTLNELLKTIEKIDFGIFVDSGPIHVAKILKKNGIYISTSVGGETILNDFKTIHEIQNTYKSNYCKAPCGLTNIFNFKNNIGCYDTLKINMENIMKLNNLNSLQRGETKKSYIHFLNKPVGCQKNIDYISIINTINRKLKN